MHTEIHLFDFVTNGVPIRALKHYVAESQSSIMQSLKKKGLYSRYNFLLEHDAVFGFRVEEFTPERIPGTIFLIDDLHYHVFALTDPTIAALAVLKANASTAFHYIGENSLSGISWLDKLESSKFIQLPRAQLAQWRGK